MSFNPTIHEQNCNINRLQAEYYRLPFYMLIYVVYGGTRQREKNKDEKQKNSSALSGQSASG